MSCFCLLQQTLDAGESREVPVVFRVSYELPDTIKDVSDHEPGHYLVKVKAVTTP